MPPVHTHPPEHSLFPFSGLFGLSESPALREFRNESVVQRQTLDRRDAAVSQPATYQRNEKKQKEARKGSREGRCSCWEQKAVGRESTWSAAAGPRCRLRLIDTYILRTAGRRDATGGSSRTITPKLQKGCDTSQALVGKTLVLNVTV